MLRLDIAVSEETGAVRTLEAEQVLLRAGGRQYLGPVQSGVAEAWLLELPW